MDNSISNLPLFSASLNKYSRRKTITVAIGDLMMGSDYPIRIQSMTTTDTMDTMGSVAQIRRMVEAGCELVRLTAPSIKEAENLANIKAALKKDGINMPLVADIHFTPNAAEMAARVVEKVRINPGNYIDRKKFQTLEYTDAEYQAEIDRIREKFVPLLNICKEYGTALRIGTNHGSLSDRILSRYGDTPLGMVESAMEFLRIAEAENFHNMVLSMKASNPQVMIQAYRMLVATMNEANMKYPLHLGVTEAGDGDDGRIKSALGIGSLLEDGIGDTIRVSLTEDPEFEVPVARRLVARYSGRTENAGISPVAVALEKNASRFLHYQKRVSAEVSIFGGNQVPRVIASFDKKPLTTTDLEKAGYKYDAVTDKWNMTDLGADLIYTGSHIPGFMLPVGLKALVDAPIWYTLADKTNNFPVFTAKELAGNQAWSSTLNFFRLNTSELSHPVVKETLQRVPNTVLLLSAATTFVMKDLRNAMGLMEAWDLKHPVVFELEYPEADTAEDALEKVMLFSSTDAGSLFTDGWGDGIMIRSGTVDASRLNDFSFGIMQAARARISKTEYISCPSCGRTLFDLQETTAMIRKRTDHLKGVKLAIMGCIVNGPGEMADADYGYVGSGPGKITLYKGKEVVQRSIPSAQAVDALIQLIRDDGKWVEPVS